MIRRVDLMTKRVDLGISVRLQRSEGDVSDPITCPSVRPFLRKLGPSVRPFLRKLVCQF